MSPFNKLKKVLLFRLPGVVLTSIFGLCFLIVLFSSCGTSHRFVVPDPPPDDRKPVLMPEARDLNLAEDNVEKIATMTTQRFFDLSRHFRSLAGSPRQAFNVDAFDEVYNSSWFINRNARKEMSVEEIARGPNTGTGPDTSGMWLIFKAKVEGVTPGFFIEDSRGDKYVIKFDPVGYPELVTGAEVVSTKLFHAAGYNVPENYIAFFHPKILQLKKDVKFTDKTGTKRSMNQQDLEEILARIQKRPDGLIRAAASKYLPGQLLGGFKYIGVREDDMNDFIPHEHRRDLRGLKVIAAWLNHYDTKANNSLDIFYKNQYVRHYLIDFGSTLGSQGNEPMRPEIGREGPADPVQTFKSIASLGIYRRPWEKQPEIKYLSIGNFSAKSFKPDKYKYILPNPAFGNATSLDDYWGTKLVMSFTDEQIRTAVEQGQYSDPPAAEYLIQTLIERRDIVGRYWFNRVNPLDKFNIQKTFDGGQELCFIDLAVKSGLESADISQYRYDLRRNDIAIQPSRSLQNKTCVLLPHKEEVLKATNNSKVSANYEIQWEVKMQVRRESSGKWSKWVKVYMTWDESAGEFDLIGIRRQK